MKVSYSERTSKKKESLKLLSQAGSLLKKKDSKFFKKEKLSELRKKIRFSPLSEKDYIWSESKNDFIINHKKLKNK